MRKVALVFVIAVIAPSLVLAWLAVGSLRDQELVLERQQTLLYQGVADAVAVKVRAAVDDLRAEFQAEVAGLLRGADLTRLPARFDPELRARWPAAEIGFVVALDGDVLAPSMFAGTEARRFRLENDRFLCSRESVEVYWNSPKGAISLTKLDQKEPPTPAPGDTSGKSKATRTVAPEKETVFDPLSSKVIPEAAAFRQIVRNGESGTLARFLQDELNVLFWYRPPLEKPLVFGARVDLARLVEHVRGSLAPEPPFDREIAVALINAAGQPVAMAPREFVPLTMAAKLASSSGEPRNASSTSNTSGNFGPTRPKAKAGRPTENVNRMTLTLSTGLQASAAVATAPAVAGAIGQTDWQRPFVATEIGEVLPHWEIAAYQLDPKKLGRSARLARLTVGLLIALLVLAIAVGSWLIVGDLKRQLALARQKTDFVSNVSHELKTPLTSIRMFSEMLAEGRVRDDDKRRHFLSIISAETARLTRLINNVLDFARLERGEKSYQLSTLDLATLARETLELYRPPLEAGGFQIEAQLPTEPILIRGDRDALAQVMVNLLSNAEKYAGEQKDVAVRLATLAGHVEWSVLDRGPGVPKGCEEKIFDQFFRAHDSLSSGIQGSGLGLTLARQIAAAHGGTVTYTPREGGGSCFTLRLPLEQPAAIDAGTPARTGPGAGAVTGAVANAAASGDRAPEKPRNES
jgi:signal transduction histidine kinase